MRSLLLIALAFILAVMGVPSSADACGNAVMVGVDDLHEADVALGEGDVTLARQLVAEYRRKDRNPLPGLDDHAATIEALSWIRDPSASSANIDGAISLLRKGIVRRSPSGEDVYVSPAMHADYGEALERGHRDQDALDELTPLADRDLMGSAYAYAALSRAAGRKGDAALSATALAKCKTIAAHPSMCTGVYPSPPLLHGLPLGYALPGLAFLAFALLRLRRSSRQQIAVKQWQKHQPNVFAVAIVCTAAFVGVFEGRSPFTALVLAIAACVVVGSWQRRAFLASVRLGKVPGFHIRENEGVADAAAPLLRLYFGPKAGETLEHSPAGIDPNNGRGSPYREGARAPVLRIYRRVVKPAWIVTAIVIGVFFVGCGSLTLMTRSRSSVFSPEE